MVHACESLKQTALDFRKLEPLLGQWSGKRVLVVGDIGVDRYTLGAVERISPEAPVPIVRVEEERHKLGLAANVADNIQSLNGIPLLVGVLGQDSVAVELKGLLTRASISVDGLVTDETRRTTLKERIVSDRQQLLRVDYENATPVSRATQDRVLATAERLLKTCDAMIVEDYAKGLLGTTTLQGLFAAARGQSKPVLVDPHLSTPLASYRGATFLTPNLKEAEALAGKRITDDASLLEAGNRILSGTDAASVAITLGKDGMAIFQKGERVAKKIPTYAREVYDVSGAGDTVIAVLALGMACNLSVEDAAVVANLAAGVEVSKRGTATVTIDEIRAAISFFGRAFPKE